ncbi:MAG: formate dehydrogenase accessory sulfurtransferase FdhD [Saprospiraceae bacterium]|nr:formate dehydrogenase accessory sulfurtransferase FdhD [Saprospiraceae bacterium]
MDDQEPGIKTFSMTRYEHDAVHQIPDLITLESPLQIVLRYGPREQRRVTRLAMTMRTPGQDAFLTAGYLYTENIIHKKEDIVQIRVLREGEILIELAENLKVDLIHQERNTYVNSSCGICGKNQLDDIRMTIPFRLDREKPSFRKEHILSWTDLLSGNQRVFPSTGGIHAAALVSERQVYAIQEDIGRHNAVDKVIGFALHHFDFPLKNMAILVSARASFELVQKALMAGIPLIAAVGATSSLAIELADENDMTLIGFLKSDRFNIYTHKERIIF